MIAATAGYGGYYHPRASSSSRTNLLQAMASEAEREGWITRERDKYGGLYNYALTEGGRNFYRETIEPHRDAFVKNYLKAKQSLSDTAAPRCEGAGGGQAGEPGY